MSNGVVTVTIKGKRGSGKTLILNKLIDALMQDDRFWVDAYDEGVVRASRSLGRCAANVIIVTEQTS